MFKKLVLAIVNFFLKEKTLSFVINFTGGWTCIALVMVLTNAQIFRSFTHFVTVFLICFLVLFGVAYSISAFIAKLAMRSLKHYFSFSERGVVQVFSSRQYIWKKDFDAMKPNLASYEERRVTLSFKCTDEQDNVSIISILISFGGTPEEMLEVIRRFGSNGIIDEMKWRISEEGVCNICKANAISVVQGILGESVHVLQIIKEQSLYCTIDNIYL